MSTPKLPGMSILEGVSCSSATECIAVGHSATSYATALAEAWGGSAWAVQPTARLAGAAGRDSYLKAVSCTTPRTCTAVGYVDGPGGFSPSKALAEAWDGSEWTAQAVPAPAGAVQSWLYGVSCSSAEACTAVGYYDPSGTSATLLSLAEEWDGSRWTVQKTPNYAAAAWSYLYSVSCVSATACTAVGSYTPAAAVGNYHPHTYVKTLAEAWDGSTWAFEPTPGPGANVPSTYELKSVSCTSASSCIAVGCHGTGLNCSDTLAEVWDGSTWEPQATANLPAVEGNNLLGVSCAGNSCAAVGYSFTKAASVALVEGERH
jgi:hypothetical protein